LTTYDSEAKWKLSGERRYICNAKKFFEDALYVLLAFSILGPGVAEKPPTVLVRDARDNESLVNGWLTKPFGGTLTNDAPLGTARLTAHKVCCEAIR